MKSTLNRCMQAILIASALAACATDETATSTTAGANPSPSAPAAAAPCPDCNKPAPKPVVDGNLAWRQGKEQTLADARALTSQLQGKKLPVTMHVAKAQKRDDASGKLEQVDAVKNVVLRPLPTDKIRAKDKAWAEAVREMGKKAAQANAHEPQQIVISALARSRANVTQWLNEGIAAAGNNQKPDIQFFEAKQAKDTAVFYQPLDQKQFKAD